MTEVRTDPLGPDSLTWRYFGDWRGVLQGLWAGSMQNMHPGLGAGVESHSRFFSERWQRLLRSLYPIGGVVFDGARAAATAAQVRDHHRDIKGVDAQGRRYHALDPETFYWAHATFFVGTLLTAEHFMGGLDDAQRRTLFEEHRRWYALYGMSMRPVPETWEDFQAYWDHMCREVLEVNAATLAVRDLSTLDRPVSWWWLPRLIWTLLRPGVVRTQLWVTTGLYDQAVRDRLGLTWTERDERRFRRFGRAVELAFRLVPPRRRMHPRARAGWDTALGRRPATAPLVETPARNLPPPEHRDDPRHYVPSRHDVPSRRGAEVR